MKIKSSIPIDKLTSIATKAGCKLTEKTTCIMVTKGSNKDNRLYIARTRDVARVNVNGFKCPDTNLTMTPPGGPVGTFLQVVRFDYPANQVMENFRVLCENLDTYTSTAKKPRGRPAGFKRSKNAPIAGPTVEVQAQETPAQHCERLVKELQTKRELSAKVGYPLSAKTIASYRTKLAELGYTLEA